MAFSFDEYNNRPYTFIADQDEVDDDWSDDDDDWSEPSENDMWESFPDDDDDYTTNDPDNDYYIEPDYTESNKDY